MLDDPHDATWLAPPEKGKPVVSDTLRVFAVVCAIITAGIIGALVVYL